MWLSAALHEREAVLVQGSFSSVKKRMAGTYAEKFARQGFIALTFDYAYYGESQGTPRWPTSTGSRWPSATSSG